MDEPPYAAGSVGSNAAELQGIRLVRVGFQPLLQGLPRSAG